MRPTVLRGNASLVECIVAGKDIDDVGRGHRGIHRAQGHERVAERDQPIAVAICDGPGGGHVDIAGCQRHADRGAGNDLRIGDLHALASSADTGHHLKIVGFEHLLERFDSGGVDAGDHHGHRKRGDVHGSIMRVRCGAIRAVDDDLVVSSAAHLGGLVEDRVMEL